MGPFTRKRAAPDLQAVERAFLALKEKSLKEQRAGIDRTSLFDADLGIYQRWYFEFRLEEEVARATRYTETFALIVVRLESEAIVQEIGRDGWLELLPRAADALKATFRATDLIGVLDEGVFAICILNSDPDGAELAGQRLEATLEEIPHTVAGTLFPYDNLGADQLLAATRHRATNAHLYPDQHQWVEMPRWHC